MEYILQLEESKRFWILGISIAAALFFAIFSFMYLGIYGIILSIGLLFSIIFTPLIYGRHKLLLFVWIIIVPLVEVFRFLEVGGFNPFTVLITGITAPYAVMLMYKEIGTVLRDLPYVKYLLLFIILIVLNFLRPDFSIMSIYNALKFHFIALFIIFSTYCYLKKNQPDFLFNLICTYVTLSAITALFQKVTGIGMVILEGIARAPGLTSFPNNNSFLMNIYLPLGLYLLLTAKTVRMKIFYGCSIFFSIIAIFLAVAKGSIVSFGLMLGILFFYLPMKYKIRTFFSCMIIGIVFILINNSLNLGIIELVVKRFDNKTSLLWRYKIWNMLIETMTPLTYLIGNGIDSSSRCLLRLNPTESSSGHNSYLEFLYEYGILGLTYFLNFLMLGYRFFKISISKVYKERILYITPFLVIFAVLMEAISSNGLFLRGNMNYAWIIITVFFIKATQEFCNVNKSNE